RAYPSIRPRPCLVRRRHVLAGVEPVSDERLRGRHPRLRGADRARARERLGAREPVPDRDLPAAARTTGRGGRGLPADRRSVREQPLVGARRRPPARARSHSVARDTMTRVLVTGATGFIGSALVPRLVQAGYVPRLLAR